MSSGSGLGSDDDAVFRALADPTRRALLDRLRERNGQTLGELCGPLDMARQSATQHLGVLAAANLISVVRRGREKLHYLNPVPLWNIQERWIEKFEQPRMRALSAIKQRAEESPMAGQPDYVYVTYIESSPERVWQALTDPDLSARYWGHSNVSDWAVGSTWEHRRVDGSGVADVIGTVLEATPPRRLTVTFDAPGATPPGAPSRVTFDIEPFHEIVRLTVTHENLPDGDALEAISAGWPAVCANLKSLLETGHVLPRAPWEMHAELRAAQMSRNDRALLAQRVVQEGYLGQVGGELRVYQDEHHVGRGHGAFPSGGWCRRERADPDSALLVSGAGYSVGAVEEYMSELRFGISMSLDGFVAGPEQSVANPLGVGGRSLHEWLFALAAWRKEAGLTGGETNASTPFAGNDDGFGAVIMGRNMFGDGPGPWAGTSPDAEQWQGWWGEDPPFHVPVFVLTHHERAPLQLLGGNSFTFVTGGIHEALDMARRAAGGKDVGLYGGGNTARQYLAAGLVAEMRISLVPVLLGGGVRLLGGPELAGVALEQVRVVEAPGVTHLVYRVTH